MAACGHATRPRKCERARSRGGFVYLAALLVLVLFGALGLAMASATNLELQKGANQRQAVDARLAAESGMSVMLQKLSTVRLPGSTDQATFPAYLAQELGEKLNGTANLAGATVFVDGSAVCVPVIALGDKSFSSRLTWLQQNVCRLVVSGTSGGLKREIAIACVLQNRQPAAFDYGLASKGKIVIGGSSKLVGVNYPAEASVLSAVGDMPNAIDVSGSATVSGDLNVTGNPSSVSISGNPSIAGSTNPADWVDHIHFGIEAPDFPEVDVAPLTGLATGVVNSSTDTNSKDLVFNNIRIAAGTNPTFSSDVVINGIVYVEAPNVVHFTGKTTLNGFLVTQDADLPLDQCRILFTGQVDAHGVEALPNTPQFAAVKQETGSFIVAPGFGVTFSGHVTAMNGNVAADQLTFTGTAEGTIRGSLVCLTDNLTKIDGNVEIYIDRKNADPNPAGFVSSFGLEPDAGSYVEVTGE